MNWPMPAPGRMFDIRLVLADELAEAVADTRSTEAVAADGLRRELGSFTCCGG